MDSNYIKRIIKMHGKTTKHVAYQCFINERRLYRFLNGERQLRSNELYRLSKYITMLEDTELFREPQQID